MADEKTPLSEPAETKPSKEPPKVGFADPSSDQKEPVPLLTVPRLFRFCDRIDAVLLTFGAIGCLLYGAVTPSQFIIFGELTDDFIKYTICARNASCLPRPDLEESLTKTAGWYIGFAFANFFFSWMGLGLFALSAERQVYKIRLAMFRSAVYQEIGWFDKHSTGELNSRLSEDINKIADGIGSKFGRIISSLMSFAAGYAIGFTYVWQLSLVMISMLPLLLGVGALMAKVTGSYTAKELEAYSKAGHVAEQSISSIRTVAAFGGEEKQAELYDEHLAQACKFGIKKGFGIGFGMGAFQLVFYGNYGLSIWYMIKLVRDGDASPGDGMTAFFAITMASMILGQTAPSGEALAAARAAGYTVFSIMDRESKIDASSNAGQKPATIKGDVDFSHIDFVYPTRESVQVLNDFSLKIPSGKRVAFVGESGCGKSTVVKLIQRFYDPLKGSVKLDGQDIKSLNVSHLRSLIGVVNQEPVLFATTIAENIAFGHEGATQDEIEEAAKMANAHDFITQFPQGYDTGCGERGVQMSGGQKQRIAIARALVRNPKILLLDEATSALDTHSEAVVQEALDKAGEGRTTIIIAHRLSTIKNADIIVAVRDGHVAEMGTHDELMALDGLYSTLVKLQESVGGDDENDNDDDGDDDDVNEVDSSDGAFHLTSLLSASVPSIATHEGSQLIIDDGTPDDSEAKIETSFTAILKENAPEWKYLIIGCFGAALFGAYPPLFSFCFGGIFEAFDHDPTVKEQNEEMDNESKKWAVALVLTGLESGIGILLQYWFLAKAGEALTKRLRKRTFLAFLRQEISYYDHHSHGTGAICTRLSAEVSAIQGATGAQLGLIASGIVTTVGGVYLGFSSSWRLTLLSIAFIPFLVLSGLAFNKFLGGGGDQSSLSTEGALAADETLSNIQTVVSLGLEDEFFERYRQALAIPYRNSKRNSHLAGLVNGSFFGIMNFSFAASFRYGGYLVTNGDITISQMMRAIMAVLVCAVIFGQSLSMTPDYSKAKQAANRVFYLLAKVPHIDSYSHKGNRPDSCNGEIEISNVRFRYPTRRKFKVLRDLSFKVNAGKTVALVGTSGCGKSTSVSLVERFYDTNTGSVMIDGNDVKELNLKWLRRQIGIVSQEPVLFDLSIRDNIAYGDTTRLVNQDEIVEAARSANIHEFIESLPKGYDTIVGDKGTLISGGQKQRIAIARALVRDPKILLLDEATSALDTESEKVVQQALDKASVGRTTLVIAHRLSTIQNADVIVVIKKGRVVEQGTHQQLLALKGIYYTLNKAQSLAGV